MSNSTSAVLEVLEHLGVSSPLCLVLSVLLPVLLHLHRALARVLSTQFVHPRSSAEAQLASDVLSLSAELCAVPMQAEFVKYARIERRLQRARTELASMSADRLTRSAKVHIVCLLATPGALLLGSLAFLYLGWSTEVLSLQALSAHCQWLHWDCVTAPVAFFCVLALCFLLKRIRIRALALTLPRAVPPAPAHAHPS